MKKVVIIGGGASGIMLAARLKYYNSNIDVTIIEKNNKLGKKLLITGNGKCNLGNANVNISNYYSSNLNILSNMINIINVKEMFNDFGILIEKDKNNGLYPFSMQSKTVLCGLTGYLNKQKINIIYDVDVINIIKEDGYKIIGKDKTYNADIVVIATGGKTHFKSGSTGEGYKLLKEFNHSITKLYPALTFFNTSNTKLLEGVRVDAKASLLINDKILKSEVGQVQFNKNNISGICIFNLSLEAALYDSEDMTIRLDLMPEYSIKKVKELLENGFKLYNNNLEYVLSLLLNSNIAKYISSKSKKEITTKKIAYIIKNLDFKVSLSNDYAKAQVTYGGALLNEFTNNLESKLNENLYVTGELLDVTGMCGGYNLSWCFQSAEIVAKDIVKKY